MFGASRRVLKATMRPMAIMAATATTIIQREDRRERNFTHSEPMTRDSVMRSTSSSGSLGHSTVVVVVAVRWSRVLLGR